MIKTVYDYIVEAIIQTFSQYGSFQASNFHSN